MASIIPVVLSGGVGTRLWPLSTTMVPKQFMRIWEGGTSLFEQTLMRVAGPAFAAPVVIANVAQEAVIRDSAARAGVVLGGMVLEPTPRDSAAAIAAAAAWIAATYGEDATLAVLPADHLIPDAAAFRETLRRAAAVAAEGYIVTVGIAPDRPATEFGYIERGLALNSHAGAYAVARFKEKPAREVAEAYLATGGFDWNAGMFVFRADAFAAEAARHMRDIRDDAAAAVTRGAAAGDVHRLHPELFGAVRKTSIDYALIEASHRVAVVPAAFTWSDVGNWRSVHAALANGDGNHFHGDARAKDCTGSLVIGSDLPVRVLGLDNIGVIATPEGVLVVALDRAADIKELLN
jgi:mannose-1-phosphate guanylyltransferase/mannose-6-phosphate isomerase